MQNVGINTQCSPIKPLGALTLMRVFWRSLFLQAAWNPQGMQNLGFAYALYPALRELYPDARQLATAAERHLCCFNSHPYFAAAILGGALHHEQRLASGEEPSLDVNMFKQSLMGPLAALGDGFFWLSLRPACGAISALIALVLALGERPTWAALIAISFYLATYNLVHIVLRMRFFVLGYRLGDEVVPVIAASRLPLIGQKLRVVAAIGAGAVGGLEVCSSSVGGGWAIAGAGALFVSAYAFLGRGVSPYALAYGSAALALFAGLFF